MWLDTSRKRHIDKDTYDDGAVVEGSNAKKNMCDSEMAKLKKLAVSSCGDLLSGFLRSMDDTLPSKDVPAADGEKDTEKPVLVEVAGPRVLKACAKELKVLAASLTVQKAALQAAANMF